MTARKTPVRVLVIAFVAALIAALFPAPSDAVTKTQVDEACADSSAQLAEYRAAQSEFEEAAFGYETALNEVEALEYKQSRIEGQVESNSQQYDDVQAQLEQQAVLMYMRGGFNNPGLILSASSVDEVMTSSEFLSSATVDGQQSISDLVAARGELNRFQDDLEVTHGELKDAEAVALEFLGKQEAAMEAQRSAYNKLSAKCRELTTKYNQEQAALKAAAARRASGSVQVGNFICPFTPGRTSFIDSWGYPRSGGRTHKGVDMFAARGEPMYAVQSGTARATSNSLGGLTVHLTADTGYKYYYAHLDRHAFSGTRRVTQGEVIGYNGSSGNARGIAPHLHFEIRPGGGAPVNPYPTVRAACY